MAKNRGLLIVFEGIDNSGKTTQCDLLCEHFENKNQSYFQTQFPRRSSQTGQIIDSYLRSKSQISDQAVHLLFSANRWEDFDMIKSLLENGCNVVVDRYAYSGIAYSVAKGLDKTWCLSSDEGLLQPDIVFFLHLPDVEHAHMRENQKLERYENVEFQKKVS